MRIFILAAVLLAALTLEAADRFCPNKMNLNPWRTSQSYYSSIPERLTDEPKPNFLSAENLKHSEAENIKEFLMIPAVSLDPSLFHFENEDFLLKMMSALQVGLYPQQILERGSILLRNYDKINETGQLSELGEYILENMTVQEGQSPRYFLLVLNFFPDYQHAPHVAFKIVRSVAKNEEALKWIGRDLVRVDFTEKGNSVSQRIYGALRRIRRTGERLDPKTIDGLRIIIASAHQSFNMIPNQLQFAVAEDNLELLENLIKDLEPHRRRGWLY
jgi:hypothetical protein